MDAPPSRTGVFYQAMPAVGADGKNIVKLIPVKIVNRQFHQTQQKLITTNNPPTLVPVVKYTARNQFTSQEFIRKQVSAVNILPNQMHSARLDSVKKHPLQQQFVNLIPQTAAPPTRLSHLVPVTVKSPVLPRGQSLKIPPNAQVQRVPASELPPQIKDQIFTSSACSSASSVTTVVYVSPVTVNQGVTEPSGFTTPPLKLLSNTNPPRAAKPQLKLVPKVSERANSPIRWVIEEVESCTAETQKPLSSPSGDPQSAAETDNALVMYNGRVFFVAKNNGSSLKSSAATQQSHDPAVLQTRQNLRVPSNSNDVIDLCDDDQEDSHQPAPSSNTSTVSHQDEDNVIFVSYIPPRSESSSVQTASRWSNSRADVSVLRGKGKGQNSSRETGVCGPTVKDVTESPNPQSQQSISDLQRDNVEVDTETGRPVGLMEVDTEPGCPAGLMEVDTETGRPVGLMEVDTETGRPVGHDSREEHVQTPQSSKLPWTSPPAPEPCQRSDGQLRQIFGITFDVKICLQKIDDAAAGCVSADLLQTESRRDDEKPTNGFKEKEPTQNFNCPNKLNDSVLTEYEPSASLHTRTVALNSSDFNSQPPFVLQESCCSGQKLSHHSETKPVIGYVEPIDEDFPDEGDESAKTTPHLQTQTCVDVNTNRRVGRTRKRTMCPCCIPAALHPAVKSGVRLEELEAWMLITEQTGKRAGRTKASKKDGRTSVKISYQNCKIHEAPGLSSTSTDKFKRHKPIGKLKGLQVEKET